MNSKTLLVLAIILGVVAAFLLSPTWLAVRDREEPPSGELVRSMHFVLQRGEAVWLDESASLFLAEDGRRLLITRSTLSATSPAIGIATQSHYDARYRPVAYQLAAETSAGTQIVSGQSDGTRFAMEVRAGGARQAATARSSDGAFLLDNNVIAHYALLFEAIRAEAVPQTFSAIVPQVLAEIPARWADGGAVRFLSGDKAYDGKQITVGVGDVEIALVSYEGRLVGLVNRTQGTVAYDVDLLPNGLALPTEPMPATGVERRVAFSSGDLALVGTLSLPAARAPFAAVLIVGGSGPLDRDGNAPGLRMEAYRELALGLAQGGIASLRYDKRGVGESAGVADLASRTDLAADVRAAWTALAAQPEVANVPRFALGHSEGAYLVADLAADAGDVAGLVLLSGSPQSLAAVTRWQVETLVRAQGATEDQVAVALEQEDEYLAFVRASSGQWSDYTVEALRAALPWLSVAGAEQLKRSPLGLVWLREHYNADPRETLTRVSCPVLILSGAKDMQVPPRDGEVMAEVLGRAGNERVTSILMEDLNHVLRYHPEEPNLLYQHLDAPIDPRVVDTVRSWIDEVTVD